MMQRQYFATAPSPAASSRRARAGRSSARTCLGDRHHRQLGRRGVARRARRTAPSSCAPGFRRVGVGYAFGTFIGHGGAGVVTADFAGRYARAENTSFGDLT
jgi:hypothetical protein